MIRVLDVEIRRLPSGGTVCQLDGDLVASEAQVVRSLPPVVAHGGALVVDLTNVTRFDRVGLGALVGLLRLAHRTSARVELTGVAYELRAELRREGLDRLYPMAPAATARRHRTRRPTRVVHGGGRS